MSSPRAATSVATITGRDPFLKLRNVLSRSYCDLSPWIAEAPNCRARPYAIWSHCFFVLANTITFAGLPSAPRGKLEMISGSRLSLANLSLTTSMRCSMSAFAFSWCGSPMKTCTVLLTTNCAAMLLTSFGHVAEKKSVWRDAGTCLTIF